ncbi:MAG TPA: thioesterase family protein [Aquihabitans sp.]|jgi:acyl-CoA thioesterase-2|nr:thioesterase family protein [Aquihabitans sp.]
MGDLADDTAVEDLGDGRYQATLHPDWEIWGPMGGYVAAIALRAAGAAAAGAAEREREAGTGDGAVRRPATFACHYLGVGRFEPVDILVEARREGRAASSHRIEVSQDGRRILDASAWSVADVPGLEHDESVAPEVPGPDDLQGIEELVPEDAQPPFAFWRNFDAKPVAFEADWPPDGPRPARWREWLRFRPRATFDDPWVDAARSVILVDLPSWPSAHRPHAWQQPAFTAPTLDLSVAFHRNAANHEWLLCDGSAPVSTGGLFGWTAGVWSPDGRLQASGGGQCLYRPMRP